MISRSTLLHLRVPFSWFLLPVYLFALGAADAVVWWKAVLVFIVLHLLLYPASNSFNTYYDRDTGSIGGIKHPPPVERALLPVSLTLDLLALGLSLLVGWVFTLAVLVYGLCSKAYSWDKIRLKRFPLWGVLGTALITGALGFWMSLIGVQNAVPVPDVKTAWAVLAAGLHLLSSFPLTQVYQHNEDRGRGDRTLSLALGVRGTFLFSGAGLTLSLAGVFAYCLYYDGFITALAFAACAVIPAAYFFHWMDCVFRDSAKADYDHAMRQSLLSASALNVFFAALAISRHVLHLIA